MDVSSSMTTDSEVEPAPINVNDITAQSQRKIHASMNSAEDEEFNMLEPMQIPISKSIFRIFQPSKSLNTAKRRCNNNAEGTITDSKKKRRKMLTPSKTYNF